MRGQLPALPSQESRIGHRAALNLLERAGAALMLLGLIPLFAVCAVGIVVTDRGPVLFRQRRIGKDGRPFMLLKLRSMKAGGAGPGITGAGDQRITPFGKLLRDYKIDELPQLWNVVRGEMSVIGPRPEVPEHADVADVRWQAVLSARPGLTDLASLVFRHEEQLLSGHAHPEQFYREWLLPRKLDLSAHYIRSRSLKSDIRLVALTVRHVLIRRGHCGHEIARQFDYKGAL